MNNKIQTVELDLHDGGRVSIIDEGRGADFDEGTVEQVRSQCPRRELY